MGAKRKALDEADIARSYLAGEGPTSIGRRYGVSDQTVRNRLRERGVQLRPAAGGMVAALLARFGTAGLAENTLDDLVHDVASSEASQVNNGGLTAQIPFLLRQLGFEAAIAAIEEAG